MDKLNVGVSPAAGESAGLQENLSLKKLDFGTFKYMIDNPVLGHVPVAGWWPAGAEPIAGLWLAYIWLVAVAGWWRCKHKRRCKHGYNTNLRGRSGKDGPL